jgi:hypothetical protein
MSKFSRASLILVNNSGNLYSNNYSLVLKVNPRLNLINSNTNQQRFNSDKSGKVEKPKPVGISYKNLTVGVVRETFANERRVAITPAVTQNLVKKGFKVVIEENAGALAKFPNDQYEKAGAKIESAKNVYAASDILLKVRAPDMNVNIVFFILVYYLNPMCLYLKKYYLSL